MSKFVELLRHTANEGDVLTSDGVAAAVELGRLLADTYDRLISSGAQRATQTLACALGGAGRKYGCGVIVEGGFRSEVEDRWFEAYRRAGASDLASFLREDPGLVQGEAKRFGDLLRGVFDALPEGGRALVVGHSPMHEVAVYGLTGEMIEPLGKGARAVVTSSDSGYLIEVL